MTADATMTLTVDGVTTAPFTLDDLKAATAQVKQTMRAMQRRRGFGSTLLANNAGPTTLDAARKTILGG